MRVIRAFFPLVLAGLLWGLGPGPARAGEGVSIDELVKMRDSGWSDELIIKMVRKKGVGFEVSVENLNRLRGKKVSDNVLMAIIDLADAEKSPAEPAKEPAPPPPDPAPVRLPTPTPAPAPVPVQPSPAPAPGEVPEFDKKAPPVPVPEPRKKCPTCGSCGLLICPRHRPADFVISNTMKQLPACCGGLGWVECPACRDGGTKALLTGLGQQLAARVTEWEKMDKTVGLRLFHGETRHVALDTDLPPHEAAKVAAHCEGLLLKLRKLFKDTTFEFTRPGTMRIACLGRVDTYTRFAGWFGSYAKLSPEGKVRVMQSNGITLYGANGYALCVRERTGRDFTNYIVNGYGHILVMHLDGYKGRLPGWIPEGFGSFCETLELGKPGVWNFDYDPKDIDTRGNWKQAVKRAVQAGRTVPLAQLMAKSLTEMKALDYQQAWSVTSALIYGGPGKYVKFLRGVKDRQDQTEALEKAYGSKLQNIEGVWKSYAARQ